MLIKGNKELKQSGFAKEKDLQKFVEENMQTILGIQFIETEFSVGNFRIDSLAYDKESNAFRIIEYKNIKNGSLVDQGYTYLKVMLDRKADFILKYNEQTNSKKGINDIDWTQSRIVFISPTFTDYQLNATDFKNIPIDLIKITQYENEIVDIDFIKKTSNIKIQEANINSVQEKISKEVIVYTEEDHLKNVEDNIKNMYEKLKVRILELGDIDIEAKLKYVAFKGSRNIVDIIFKRSELKLDINVKKGTLKDPLKMARDISNIGHFGNGDYEVVVKNEDDIENAIFLIKQSLEINCK